MVAFIVLLGIIFGGVKLLAVANNISDSEAMDKYSGKLFVVGIIFFVILMCVIGNNDDYLIKILLIINIDSIYPSIYIDRGMIVIF